MSKAATEKRDALGAKYIGKHGAKNRTKGRYRARRLAAIKARQGKVTP